MDLIGLGVLLVLALVFAFLARAAAVGQTARRHPDNAGDGALCGRAGISRIGYSKVNCPRPTHLGLSLAQPL
jgi:hypothetical protein